MADTTQNIEVLLAHYRAQFNAAWGNLRRSTPGLPIHTGSGAALIVTGRSYGKVAAEDVLSGRAEPISIVATEDGREAITNEWHEGPATGDSVYVERWEGPSNRPFHGYVDPTSRKLVQVG